MSHFWKQAEYAEDQKYSKTILTIHVLDRGQQVGTVFGFGVGGVLALLQRRRQGRMPATAAGTATTSIGAGAVDSAATNTTKHLNMGRQTLKKPDLWRTTMLRSSGAGAITGLLGMAVMLPYYMAGKSDIEWSDRAWRLLSNRGQVEVDRFSFVGVLAGFVSGVGVFVRKGREAGTIKLSRGLVLDVVGRSAVGGMLGVVGYMGWSHGVHRGKRDDELKKNGL